MLDLPTHRVVLASSSPRRRALLEQLGFEVAVTPPAVDESSEPGEAPLDYVRRMARSKAEAVIGEPGSEGVVVSADTIVIADGEILGKPPDGAAARSVLARLSDRWHEVITGFCVVGPGDVPTPRYTLTRVCFKELAQEEIARYVATDEWCDKAGGYGIQGGAAFMVTRIDGSYTNVVGLPLAEVVDDLGRCGVVPRGVS